MIFFSWFFEVAFVDLLRMINEMEELEEISILDEKMGSLVIFNMNESVIS